MPRQRRDFETTENRASNRRSEVWLWKPFHLGESAAKWVAKVRILVRRIKSLSFRGQKEQDVPGLSESSSMTSIEFEKDCRRVPENVPSSHWWSHASRLRWWKAQNSWLLERRGIARIEDLLYFEIIKSGNCKEKGNEKKIQIQRCENGTVGNSIENGMQQRKTDEGNR